MSHVVVAGGASGIGAATAKALASAGTLVTVIDISPRASWWEQLPKASRVAWIEADLSNQDSVAEAMGSVVHEGLDGLVNCAGRVFDASILDLSATDFLAEVVSNLALTAVPAREAGRLMIERGVGGSIVNCSSTAGHRFVRGLGTSYHTAKAAIIGLTTSLAGEWAPHGIRVNCVLPGLTRTPMAAAEIEASEPAAAARVPLGRIGEPDEVAALIRFLLSDGAAMITGSALPVDGGQLAMVGNAEDVRALQPGTTR